MSEFRPTEQQTRVIEHDGSAFVTACPGAGKTRVLVERARYLLRGKLGRRGIAFLSFTNAAVSELEERLRLDGLLPAPPFPHFVGTFDAFIWQFFVAPFGVPGCDGPPRLVEDKGKYEIAYVPEVRPLPMDLFDRQTGLVIDRRAREIRFDPHAKPWQTKRYEDAARAKRARDRAHGLLDFSEARELAAARLADGPFSARLAEALSARFVEVVIDEAQDCNPSDLSIIEWFRIAGIPTKVICDPHQSIYGFRGGVSEELFAYRDKFLEKEQLPLSGNFRSSPNICKGIAGLRHKDARLEIDEAVGKHKDVANPIHVLSYAGAVSQVIANQFKLLVEAEGLQVADCPVVASTRDSCGNAIGQPTDIPTNNATSRLAFAVTGFHFSSGGSERKKALKELHHVILDLGQLIQDGTYHQYVVTANLNERAWVPQAVGIAQSLRFNPVLHQSADLWHANAKAVLEPFAAPSGRTISQQLPKNRHLATALASPVGTLPPARTIHSVKGMEFPAVCVVLTKNFTKGILDYLETGMPTERAEEARKLYVAASRAERLLCLAVPRSQADRLAKLLQSVGAAVELQKI